MLARPELLFFLFFRLWQNSKMLHFLLVFLQISRIFSIFPTSPCSSTPSITFRGANDITRAGSPALVVFAPIQCANCYNYLRRLNDLGASRTFRIYVVAPDFESNHLIQQTSSAFPNLLIDRAVEGWPRLGAKNFDAFILDGCSRILETFQWPQSDVTTSSAIQKALESTTTFSRCDGGRCGFQMNPTKRVNAYLKEQEIQRQIQNQNQMTSRQQHQNPQNYQRQNQNHQNPPYHHQNNQNFQNQNLQNYPPRHQNPQNQNLQNSQNPQVYSNHGFYTPPPPPPQIQIQKTSPKTTTTTTESTTVDYDYYPDEVLTTPPTQTQIPRPPSNPSSSNWPTLSPFFNHQNPPNIQNQNLQNPWNSQYPYPNSWPQQNPKNPGGPIMDANLPCSAFTDDICHQQKEQMGSLVSKCCNKGIYLTDVCIPGKCSNSTTQLCCFQKFLQAKYSCCNDPTQDEGAPKLTNNFNKCCHNLFISDDPCCPEEAARRYWSTAYEICMPTVTVDLSPVRFEVHFTEGVRVLDLSIDRQWDFNCTYGKKRPQFAYIPNRSVNLQDLVNGL